MEGADAGPLGRADALLAVRRYAEAERFAREALARVPGSERGHALLSMALGGQRRFEEAVRAAEEGIFHNPTSEWLHRARAFALWQRRKFRPALLAAEQALKLDALSAAAHNVRSLALLGLRRIAEARAAAETAVALGPGVAVYRAQLGDTWSKESPVTAEAHYRASLMLDAEQPAVLNNLGVALRRQRRYDEAAQALKGALSLDPAQPHAKVNLFAVSNPMLRVRWLGWLGIALGVAIPVQAVRYGAESGSAWPLWSAVGSAVAYLVVLALVASSRQRRLAVENPEAHALRKRVEADLNEGRIVLGPGLGRFGMGLAIFGGLTLAASLALEVVVIRQWVAFPAEPRRSSLEDARMDEWVILRDATLQCDSRREVRAGTFFAGQSTGGRSFVVSVPHGEDCPTAQASLRGVLVGVKPILAEDLLEVGFPMPAGDPPRLCTERGPSESRLGVVVLLVFVVAGAVLLWEGLKLWRQGRRERLR